MVASQAQSVTKKGIAEGIGALVPPDKIGAYNKASMLANQGAIAHNQKDYKLALQYYQKALDEYPQHSDALINSAFALYELKAYREASAILLHIIQTKGLKKTPGVFLVLLSSLDRSDAHQFLTIDQDRPLNSSVLSKRMLRLELINFAISLFPENKDLLVYKVNHLLHYANYEECMEFIEKNPILWKEKPSEVPAYVQCLIALEKKEEVKQIVQGKKNLTLSERIFMAKEGEDFNPDEVCRALIEAYKKKSSPKDLVKISSIMTPAYFEEFLNLIENIEKKTDNLNIILPVFFNAALIFDKAGQFTHAFDMAARGHAICPPPFIPEHKKTFESIKSVFNKEFIRLKRQRSRVSRTNRPIYITGMPRSGTSLLEQVLSVNESVTPLGESDTIVKYVRKYSPHLLRSLFPAYVKGFTRASFKAIGDDHEKSTPPGVWTDKLPHNFLNIGFINIVRPDAKIINIHRDDRDVTISIWLRNFAGDHNYANSFDFLLEYMTLYNDLLNFWRNEVTENIVFINYEDLVTDFRGQLNPLLDFVGLEKNCPYEDFYKIERVVMTASKDQVRKPLSPKSIGHWKNYAQYF